MSYPQAGYQDHYYHVVVLMGKEQVNHTQSKMAAQCNSSKGIHKQVGSGWVTNSWTSSQHIINLSQVDKSRAQPVTTAVKDGMNTCATSSSYLYVPHHHCQQPIRELGVYNTPSEVCWETQETHGCVKPGFPNRGDDNHENDLQIVWWWTKQNKYGDKMDVNCRATK